MAAVVGISKSAVSPSPNTQPHLLIQLEPAHRVFFSNLTEFFRSARPAASGRPSAPFWPDVFVESRLPWSGFLESALWHAVMLTALWVVSHVWLNRPELITKSPLRHSEVLYYSPSEYLPPIDTGGMPSHIAQKAEPEYAKQPIISVPPESDNRAQTVVTPSDVKLTKNVAVPNIVAWNQAAPSQPLSATTALRRNLAVPQISPIAPAPDLNQATSRQVDAPEPTIVAPPPELTAVSARQLTSPQLAVIAPPPAVHGDLRKPGQINIGSSVVAPAPQLPMPEQRTSAATALGIASSAPVPPAPSLGGSVLSSGPAGVMADARGQAVPPPPTVGGAGTSPGGGRLIALGLYPSAAPPPAAIEGNRRGVFAASPDGKPGASGTPGVLGTSPGEKIGGGSTRGNGGTGADSKVGIPAGIHVGAGPNSHSASAVAGDTNATESTRHGVFGSLMADNRPMRVTVSPHATTASSRAPTEIERSIFHDRKSYSMILNMPNLNSVGGSWIVRFAEKSQGDDGADLTAPEATRKVDPGYPAELMRQNVQGTVILYAVIRSDGTVGDVRVLSSVDERLDQFARSALTRWHFKPATRNGSAVDLEAVVTIPFRARNSF